MAALEVVLDAPHGVAAVGLGREAEVLVARAVLAQLLNHLGTIFVSDLPKKLGEIALWTGVKGNVLYMMAMVPMGHDDHGYCKGFIHS